jgi:hypothetical protein
LHTTSNAFNANQKFIGNVSGYYINKEVTTLVYPKDTLVAIKSLNACEWVIYNSTTRSTMGEEYNAKMVPHISSILDDALVGARPPVHLALTSVDLNLSNFLLQ